MIVTIRKDRTIKNITIELEKTRVLIPLVHELWPNHGMGFTYTINPPAKLYATRLRFSGILKKFKHDGTIMTINVDPGDTPTNRLKVFVSVPGKERSEDYYRKVKSHLQAQLCKPVAKNPAKFETIVRSLIE